VRLGLTVKVMSINWRFERPLTARKACGGPGNAFIPHPPRWPRARTKFARRRGANSAEVAHSQPRTSSVSYLLESGASILEKPRIGKNQQQLGHEGGQRGFGGDQNLGKQAGFQLGGVVRETRRANAKGPRLRTPVRSTGALHGGWRALARREMNQA
jgi:hypothetical protein